MVVISQLNRNSFHKQELFYLQFVSNVKEKNWELQIQVTRHTVPFSIRRSISHFLWMLAVGNKLTTNFLQIVENGLIHIKDYFCNARCIIIFLITPFCPEFFHTLIFVGYPPIQNFDCFFNSHQVVSILVLKIISHRIGSIETRTIVILNLKSWKLDQSLGVLLAKL